MNVVDWLRAQVVVAVIRAPTFEAAVAGTAALVKGGVRAIEITYSTPNAAAVVKQLRREYADHIVVGAGTVTTVEQVNEAVAAGAQFLVSPGVHYKVAQAMHASSVAFALGAITPSEVMAAVEVGADIVKLFPGSLGGPGYLRALRGPFPNVAFMPTGGVSATNAREWLKAGACCLGASGDLVSRELLAAGEYDEITRRAKLFKRALELSS